MWIIIVALIALVLGATGCYFILKPKLNNIQQLNQQVIEQNNILQSENQELEQNKNQLSSDVKHLQNQKIQLDAEVCQIENDIMNSKMLADKVADTFYQQSMDLAMTNLEHSLEQEGLKYQEAIKEYENELARIMKDNTQIFVNQTAEYSTEIQELKNKISSLRETTAAAVDAAKRAEEMKDLADFYRIQLSDLDLQEIEMLRSISPYLRDKEPLNKIIWKYYYEKPTNDLIGRVIGSGIHSGVYKITHIESGRCYVGQAVKLADEKLYPMTVGGLRIPKFSPIIWENAS